MITLVHTRRAQRPSRRRRARRHATVLFTDIEESTAHLARVGDDAWSRILEAHDRMALRLVRGHGGWVIRSTGDGVLAVFWDAGLAVACARQFVREATAAFGLVVRGGLHSGECLLLGRDVAGLTVHIAARVTQLAAGGEIRITESTRQLLPCADEPIDCGSHRLRGVPGELQLFALSGGALDRDAVRLARAAS